MEEQSSLCVPEELGILSDFLESRLKVTVKPIAPSFTNIIFSGLFEKHRSGSGCQVAPEPSSLK